MVGFDPSLSTVSQYQDLAIEKVYLMANFFDAIFSMAFSQLKLGKDAKATDDMIRQVLTQEKLVNNLQADFHGNVADASSALENER